MNRKAQRKLFCIGVSDFSASKDVPYGTDWQLTFKVIDPMCTDGPDDDVWGE